MNLHKKRQTIFRRSFSRKNYMLQREFRYDTTYERNLWGPNDKIVQTFGRVCHFDIKNISRAKCQILQRFLKENGTDLIQETHRRNILGLDILSITCDRAYDVVIYVRKDIKKAYLIFFSTKNNVHVTRTKISDITKAHTSCCHLTSLQTQILPRYSHTRRDH